MHNNWIIMNNNKENREKIWMNEWIKNYWMKESIIFERKNERKKEKNWFEKKI